METELAQEIRFCTADDGVKIAYAITGKGPPIVRAAHYLSHLEFELGSPVWKHWIQEFSRDNRYIRYDERGSGLSDWMVPKFSFAAWVRDLETVVDTLGLDQFILLGVSQGGPVSIAYAARHPDRVSKLILYGTYAVGVKRGGNREELEVWKAMHRLITLGWGKDEPAFRQMFTGRFMPEASPEQIRWMDELQRVSCSPENAVKFDSEFESIDVRGELPRITTPTLVLHARDDQVVSFESGRWLAGQMPNAKFVPLQSRNHILLEKEPAWNRFLHEIRTFTGITSVSGDLTRPRDAPQRPEMDDERLRMMVANLVQLSLSSFRVVGDYVRFEPKIRNELKDLRERILSGLSSRSQAKENYLLWAPPGSGKTYFVQQIADSAGSGTRYFELNLAELDEAEFQSAVSQVKPGPEPTLCLIDEVDARATADWPYEALLPLLESGSSDSARRTIVLAGSSASSLAELKLRMASRPKGPDLLSRIPLGNEASLPPLTVEDRMVVACSQLRRAAQNGSRSIREIEKLALYYVGRNTRLSNARQLREFAVRCAERLPPGEDRIKFDHLFRPGDPENKQFWVETRPMHDEFVNSFVLLSD